jgi:hypothetical protein
MPYLANNFAEFRTRLRSSSETHYFKFPEARGKLYELSLRFEQAGKIATGWYSDERCDSLLREFAYGKFPVHPVPRATALM